MLAPPLRTSRCGPRHQPCSMRRWGCWFRGADAGAGPCPPHLAGGAAARATRRARPTTPPHRCAGAVGVEALACSRLQTPLCGETLLGAHAPAALWHNALTDVAAYMPRHTALTDVASHMLRTLRSRTWLSMPPPSAPDHTHRVCPALRLDAALFAPQPCGCRWRACARSLGTHGHTGTHSHSCMCCAKVQSSTTYPRFDPQKK